MEKPFARILVWEDAVPRSPAEQMAWDEALLLTAREPVLRTYRWAAPAMTFGYSQRLAEVEDLAVGRPIMRRWTGGGMVFHGTDLTLALAIPSKEPFAQMTASKIYESLHRALLPAVQSLLPAARMATLEECRCGAVCFESPVAFDIVEGTRKILGGAMRRSRSGILYQGSLHLPDLDPSLLASSLANDLQEFSEIPAVDCAAKILERERYSTASWRNLR
jgi:lipoate-protein ligase A